MEKMQLGKLAVATLALIGSTAASAMDVATVKGKDGKLYFCANAKCAGNSECAGAGNAACGSLNKCANTEQKKLTGWVSAPDQATCEKDGLGKWLLFKKEYGVKDGNVAPLAAAAPQVAPATPDKAAKGKGK